MPRLQNTVSYTRGYFTISKYHAESQMATDKACDSRLGGHGIREFTNLETLCPARHVAAEARSSSERIRE